jgi:hypothetical protein
MEREVASGEIDSGKKEGQSRGRSSPHSFFLGCSNLENG